jgi:phage terminase large subunit-like protein
VRLLAFQKKIIIELFELAASGRLRYRRAYIQMPRKNGKTFLFACIALFMAYMGEDGGEVYFVAGDRQQASRAFDEVRRIVEQDQELSDAVVMYRLHMEIPATGTVLRVLSSEVGLQMGLSPSFVLFDEVAVQPTDRLWTTMSLASAARSQPMIVGISTPGWEKNSLAYRLYEHGKRVRSGEVKDPSFYFTCFEPKNPECDYTDPKVWRECNPALREPGRREEGFVSEEDFKAAIPTTPEHEFRRFRLGQWTATKDAALPAGAWDSCAMPERTVRKGEEVVVGFDGSRERDCTALIGCTLDGHLFVIEVFEPSEGERVDPKNMAEAIRQTVAYYSVRALVVDEYLWTWVMLELENSEGIEVLAVPQNNVRYVKAWQRFNDGVMEHKLTHDGDLTLARHVANLVLKSDRFGVRATRDRTAPRSFIDAAMAAQFAYSHVVDITTEPIEAEQTFFAGRR